MFGNMVCSFLLLLLCVTTSSVQALGVLGLNLPVSSVLNPLVNILQGSSLDSTNNVLQPELSKVDPALLELFSSQKTQSIVMSFGGTLDVLDALQGISFVSSLSRNEAVIKSLQGYSSSKQALAKQVLGALDISYRSYWISNTLFISDAPLALVSLLSGIGEVTAISAVPVFQLSPIVSEFQTLENQINSGQAVQWGVDQIGALKAWDVTNGKGIVVCNIDTGVRGTHEALQPNYRGDAWSWFDPVDSTTFPNDQNGHGTHTMGTIAGSHGIGVAPGATWIAARGCGTDSCDGEHLMACGQWVACPTDENGVQNPSKAPNVVSNSWGSFFSNQDFFDSVIQCWNAMGIHSAFAAGNQGPSCLTCGSPADRPMALAVGAIAINKEIARYSSKGPVFTVMDGKIVDSWMKPDICAPGSSIYSAWFTKDNAYTSLSGTSMATPHAAGVIALMLSACQITQSALGIQQASGLTVDEVKFILSDGASTSSLSSPLSCDLMNGAFPNNQFGFGEVDAWNSVQSTVLNIIARHTSSQ